MFDVVFLVQGTSGHSGSTQAQFLFGKLINFYFRRKIFVYRHRSRVLQISIHNLKTIRYNFMSIDIHISNLIVVGEGERLENSLIGEGVAWLLIDTDVLRNMVMINLRPRPA